MLVRFGTTILNNGWRKDLATNEHDVAFRFLGTKFKSICSAVDDYMLSGWTHLRLPNMIPKVSIDVLREVLDSGVLDNYKGVFKNHRISFSHHNNYVCNSVNKNNVGYITNYIKMVNLVTRYLGIEQLQMCNHVNRNNFIEVFESIEEIKTNLNEHEYGSLCLENSENGFSLKECIDLANVTDTKVIFDNLHHRINNKGEDLEMMLRATTNTWSDSNLVVKMHYSNGNNNGAHNSNLDLKEFRKILDIYKKYVLELIVIVELSYSREIIENLRYDNSFNWNYNLTFNH